MRYPMSDYGRTNERPNDSKNSFFLILLPSRAFHLPRVHHAHHARRVTLYHKTNRFWCLLTCKTKQSRLLPGLDPLLFRAFVVSVLEKLHAKHVLPGFADRSSEEREIDALTTDITRVRIAYPSFQFRVRLPFSF